MTMNSNLMVVKAVLFCSEKHVSQRRKGAAQEPYINHLTEVASLVASATGGEDVNLIAAAYLHDTLEDTATTFDELVEQFNDDIARLVSEMTDNKSLPKQRRKELQVENASKKSKRAQVIKLADKISNLRSLAASPPADWEADRREEYVNWARAVCGQLKGNNAWLDEQFEKAAAEARASIVQLATR